MERRRRDLSVTIYRILLYLSRMRERDAESKRLMRIERATGIERKELKIHLEKLVDGQVHNQISVSNEVQEGSLLALERMLSIRV